MTPKKSVTIEQLNDTIENLATLVAGGFQEVYTILSTKADKSDLNTFITKDEFYNTIAGINYRLDNIDRRIYPTNPWKK